MKETFETKNKNVINIIEFIGLFRHTKKYKDTFNNFFEGKSIPPDVTREELKQVFEGSEQAKQTFIDFYISDRKKYILLIDMPHKLNQTFNEYIRSVELLNKASSREEIEEFDSLRTIKHTIFANELLDHGFVDTYKFGRVVARILIADLELDTIETARRPRV